MRTEREEILILWAYCRNTFTFGRRVEEEVLDIKKQQPEEESRRKALIDVQSIPNIGTRKSVLKLICILKQRERWQGVGGIGNGWTFPSWLSE